MDIDDDDFPISKIIFIGNYLKELYIDHEYGWFLENTKLGLFSLVQKKKKIWPVIHLFIHEIDSHK